MNCISRDSRLFRACLMILVLGAMTGMEAVQARSEGAASPDSLTIGILNGPLSLQAWRLRDSISVLIGNQMHRGLLRVEAAGGGFEGAVAENWEHSPDGREIAFRLKSGLRFHDGSGLSCGDVKSSFERLRNNTRGTSITFPRGVRFECRDERTFVIGAKEIPAKLLDLIASPAASICKDDGLIGLGPYALKRQDKAAIQLERVSGAGPEVLVFKIGTHRELKSGYDLGRIDDLLYLGHFLKPEGRQCQVIQTLSPTSFWFGINANSPRLRLLKNRKAAQRVLEQAIAKTGIFSGELQTTSIIPYGVAGSRAPLVRSASVSNLDLERATLERIAASTGRIRLTLREVHEETYGWKRLFEALDPGRRIFDIEFLSNADFFERYYGGKLDIYLVGASVSRDDPSEVLTFFRRQDLVNQSGVREPFVDGIIEQIANARDSDEVRFLARQADLWIREQAYVLPLFSKRFSGCVSPRLAGYRFSPLGPLSMDYSTVRYRD